MKLYKTTKGILVHHNNAWALLHQDWDTLINRDHLYNYVDTSFAKERSINEEEATEWIQQHLLPPIGQQEVWAAGVTYLKSRDARMEESKESGGADCYQRVYEAERPELFLKHCHIAWWGITKRFTFVKILRGMYRSRSWLCISMPLAIFKRIPSVMT